MPSSSPALEAYVKRIGASPTKHPRKYSIDDEEEGRYGGVIKFNVCTIHISTEGEVRVSARKWSDARSHDPTDEEREAIRAEIQSDPNLTRSISATLASASELARTFPSDAIVFIYRSQTTRDEVLMLQRRVFNDETGEKHDVPWSFWSDGQWRNCEPDGLLPLFGLEHLGLNSGKPIMIHEGAKAAKHWQKMIEENGEELERHPLSEDLKVFAHLGWPGGAPNPHRVDWDPIRSTNPMRRVVLSCDNDQVGNEASSRISRLMMSRPLQTLKFTSQFPLSFDLADEWPDTWTQDGFYTGPSLDELTHCATWATKLTKNHHGKSSVEVRGMFAAEWVYVRRPGCFIWKGRPNDFLNQDMFDKEVNAYSDTPRTSQYFYKLVHPRADGVSYSPNMPPAGTHFNEDNFREVLFNTYTPSVIKSDKGDETPFLDFMKILCESDNDRHEILRWMATIISRPDVKMKYGILAISSVQGVGKSTLGSAILAPLIGRHNVAFPTERMLVESQFNSWAAHKRLIVVHEIYAGHSRKGYDNTKSLITDPDLSVNRKFMEEYPLKNWGHVLACSNSENALHIDADDRRWFIPEITSNLQTPEYWIELYRWLKSRGLSIIKNWSNEFIKDHGAVSEAHHAPMSEAKRAIIEANFTDGERIVHEIGRTCSEKTDKRMVLCVEDVFAHVRQFRTMNRSERYLEKKSTIREALLKSGLHEPKRVDEDGRRWRPRVLKDPLDQDAGKILTEVVANYPLTKEECDTNLIEKFRVKYQDLGSI
jgi:hypothetical protein